MPFKSKRQLQTCFGRQLSAKAKGEKFTWDCREWLKNKKISSMYEGPRGGLYFYAGGCKVYVPSDAQKYVRKNYTIKHERN